MAEATLAITEPHWHELLAALDRPEESASVLLAGITNSERPTLSVSDIVWVPDDAYRVREPLSLEIASQGWVAALKSARVQGRTALFFHTHPGGPAHLSKRDEVVNAELRPTFAQRTGTGKYGWFILGGSQDEPSFAGAVDDEPLRRVRVVGPTSLRLLSSGPQRDLDTGTFDRQVRAFGADGQQVLRHLRVGVVGAGGTGSAVIEQLARLGVGELTLVDPDVVTASNLTRIYGSRRDQVGEAKVDVAAKNIAAMGLGTAVRTSQGRVTQRGSMELLRDCDLLFGCTDDHAGRVVLSRMSYFYEQPLIDMGVAIAARGNEVEGIFGRVSVTGPGQPCLICRQRIDLTRAREETMSPDERGRLAAEGYAEGLGEPDPAVIAYTTAVAAAAVNEFLDLLFGFGDPEAQRELLLRPHMRALGTVAGKAQEGHFCVDPLVLGRGDVEPPLDLLWP